MKAAARRRGQILSRVRGGRRSRCFPVQSHGTAAAIGGKDAVREGVMALQAIIILIIVGAIAGWLAGMIVKGMGFGLIGNIIVGIVGAFIASWLLPQIGFPMIGGAIIGAIIYATIGAVILLVIIGLVKRA
jgi:uncharacterized membrane protein YeaQ/YmgE (transglycosylase-associated protein family)